MPKNACRLRKVLVWASLVLLLTIPNETNATGPIDDLVISADPEREVSPAVAYNSQRQEYLVVWYNDREGCDDIRARRVSRNGALVGSPFYISAGCPANRRHPDVAYNSKQNEYLVVWEHDDGTRPNTHGRRVSATGQPQGGEITLGTGAALRSRYTPAVAYANTSDKYLVVWRSFVQGSIASDIEGQAVFSLGGLDGSNFLIAQGSWSVDHEQPDLAYNRAHNEFLTAWRREDKNLLVYDIYGRRVKMTGGVGPMGPAFPIASQSGSVLGTVSHPAVAGIPKPPGVGQYLVVWERLFLPGDTDILGQRVDGNENLQGNFVDVTSLGSEDTFNPAVAGNETAKRYMVAWTLPVGAVTGIKGRTVSMAGVRSTEALIGESNADNAAVAGGPVGDFMVAFDALPVPPNDRDIYGQLWGNRVYVPLVVHNYQ
jgi:hypothetical protein